MKKSPGALGVIFLAVLLVSTSCQKKVAPPAGPALTFERVESHLDRGGNFYLYLRTEQLVERVPAAMDAWKSALVTSMGPQIPLPPAQIDAYYTLLRQSVLDTGLTQVRAFGMSTAEIDPDTQRLRSVIYSGERAKPGLLWRVGGQAAPHAIAALDYLPSTTVYAGFQDFDALALWTFAQQIVNGIPDETVRNQLLGAQAMAGPVLGMSIPDLLAGLDSELGLVVTADPSSKMTLTLEKQPVEFPVLAAALVLRVKDDKVYNVLVTKLQEAVGQMMPVTKSETDGVRMATVAVPSMGLPLTPAVARFGNYLVISTSTELIRQLARKGPNLPTLLREDATFQKLTHGEKLEANAFAYLSPRGGDLLRTFQLHSLKSEKSLPPAVATQMIKFYDFFSQQSAFSVGRLEPDGYVTTMYSTFRSK